MPYATDALAGKVILVAEDEYLLADVITSAIQSAGGQVVGPFPSVSAALESLAAGDTLPHGATLNIRLVDGESYPLADELRRRRVPFVFASAHSASSLPDRFAKTAMVAKPYAAFQVVQALAALLDPGD